MLAGVVALACAGSAFTPTSARAQAAAVEPADELYRQGIAAFREGKHADAYKLLTQAWSLKQSVDIAANLGVVELKLVKPRAAAEHLRYAIELFPVSGDQDAKAALEDRFGQAKQQVGEARIVCKLPNAEVQVDGQSLGRTPITDGKFVEPGQRRFTAVLEGYEPAEVTMNVEPGSDVTVELDLVPKPAAGAAAPRVPGEKPLWPTLVLAGGAAAGLGLGVGFIVVSQSAKGEIEDSSCRSSTCGAGFQDQVDSYNLGLSVAIPSFIVGGVALAGMITYLAVPAPDVEAPETSWITPAFGPDGAGVTYGARF